MRPIDADALFEKLKVRHDMFEGCEYIGDKARRDELGAIMADIIYAPTVELTNEAAIEHLHKTGWMQNHDREMTRPGWISVKDRLPEDETVVIAYVQHKIGWYRMFAWHDMYGWHSNAPGFDEEESDYVTHWMPLPEPPEEERT